MRENLPFTDNHGANPCSTAGTEDRQQGWETVKYRHFVTVGVKTDGRHVYTPTGRLLGLLTGAQAQMGEPARHHRIAGPLAATAVTAPVLGPLALLGMA